MKIVVATHNEGKLAEIRRILDESLGAAAAGVELVSAGSLNLPDPKETGVTFAENALLKARFVAGLTGLPAIADDSGLIVDVMGNAPGILSARWSGTHGDDAANNALLLAQIADIPDAQRTARFRCAAAFVAPVAGADGAGNADGAAGIAGTNGDNGANEANGADEAAGTEGAQAFVETVEIGEMPGVIIREPRGANGFGYDPLFVPDATRDGRSVDDAPTSAELSAAEKNAISHRGQALRALVPAIERVVRG